MEEFSFVLEGSTFQLIRASKAVARQESRLPKLPKWRSKKIGRSGCEIPFWIATDWHPRLFLAKKRVEKFQRSLLQPSSKTKLRRRRRRRRMRLARDRDNVTGTEHRQIIGDPA